MKKSVVLSILVISPAFLLAAGADPSIETLDLISFLSGSLAVVAAIATIILALACFGGCATAVLLVPVLLFLGGGITGIVTGILSFRKRRELKFAKEGRWKPITGLITGVVAAGYGLIALFNLLRD